MARPLSLLLLGALVASLPACTSPGKPAADPVASATARLQGAWRVETFVPETELELPLSGLLRAQLGQLAVTFEGNRFSATGPGVNTLGRFVVTEVVLNRISGTVYDSTGLGYRVVGDFDDRGLAFRSLDAPWKGRGRLIR